MATRGIKQLTKLHIVYCEHGGSSRAVRSYLSSPQIISFATSHPTVEILVTPRNGKHPYVRGTYVSGWDKTICVKNVEGTRDVDDVFRRLNDSSGRKMTKLTRPVVTRTPSVQGVWTPMLEITE
mmetsp:Transcript_10067/g.12432  ORF Transcript_10067/g.12432 Transcript_10067/m.12432 type:complete len:124 (+) Transcript_10067:165-536(+)